MAATKTNGAMEKGSRALGLAIRRVGVVEEVETCQRTQTMATALAERIAKEAVRARELWWISGSIALPRAIQMD